MRWQIEIEEKTILWCIIFQSLLTRLISSLLRPYVTLFLTLDLDLSKATRLGPKIANKHRPMLLTFEDVGDNIYLLSQSHFLKCHEQYNKVYLVPDRTKLERTKHKRVVEELK